MGKLSATGSDTTTDANGALHSMKGWQASMAGDQEGKGGAVCSTMTHGSSRKDLAVWAIQMLSSVESAPLSSQQTASLVSGSLLMWNWQFILQSLQQFDSKGFRSLVEVWFMVAASLGIGWLSGLIARAAGADSIPSTNTPAPEQEASCSGSEACSSCGTSSSSSSSSVAGAQVSVQKYLAVDNQDDQGEQAALLKQRQLAVVEDDVALQKKAAQAQAAAKLAECQSRLRALLGAISSSVHTGNCSSSSSSRTTSALHQLTEVLFESPVNVCELVDLGGVQVVMSVATSAVKALATQQNHAELLPVLLQVSWVLLQIAHGSPACCAALLSQHVPATLLGLIKDVVAAPVEHHESKECIVRNLCWIMLQVIDTKQRGEGISNQRSSHGGSAVCEIAAGTVTVADTASELCASGAVDVLQQLITLQCGVAPGWVAAATLGLFTQMGQQQQQTALSQAAGQAVLQRESLHGLGFLVANQPQLSDRLQGLVHGQLHHLLTVHTAELLQLLVEEQLVGVFAASLPVRLSRLLVCQLLSSAGQEVLARVEETYELDAALALAQIIPLPVHLKLPAPPGTWQQQQERGMVPTDDSLQQPVNEPTASKQLAPAAEGIYTDILACRLLLQYDRLAELLSAFVDELLQHHHHHQLQQLEQQEQQEQQQEELMQQSAHKTEALAAAAVNHQQVLPPVCDSVFQLIRHLMSRDLQLQAVQHDRGASIDDSQSAANSSAGSSNSSSSSAMEAALSAEDASGVYSNVMLGLISPQQLPAVACDCRRRCHNRCSGTCGAEGQQYLQLPALPVSPPADTSSKSIKGRPVVFQFGQMQHTVSSSMYKQICSSSKMIGSILRREGKRPIHPVVVFATPHFTPEANCWVLQCLVRWLITGQLAGFTADQAAKLWVAADFWQVDGLLVACEDVLAAAAAIATAHLEVALELCLRHRVSSLRLQRLAAQVLMKGIADRAATDGTFLHQLSQLLVQYKPVVLPALLSDMRDRLVVLCMLNDGLGADAPEEMF